MSTLDDIERRLNSSWSSLTPDDVGYLLKVARAAAGLQWTIEASADLETLSPLVQRAYHALRAALAGEAQSQGVEE